MCAHQSVLRFQFILCFSSTNLRIPSIEYEQTLAKFASHNAPGHYTSYLRHLGHTYRLIREAIEKEDYFDAMLGGLLLTVISSCLAKSDVLGHAHALGRCAMKVFKSKLDDREGFLDAIGSNTRLAEFKWVHGNKTFCWPYVDFNAIISRGGNRNVTSLMNV
jgi:hypothetical protein